MHEMRRFTENRITPIINLNPPTEKSLLLLTELSTVRTLCAVVNLSFPGTGFEMKCSLTNPLISTDNWIVSAEDMVIVLYMSQKIATSSGKMITPILNAGSESEKPELMLATDNKHYVYR